MTDTHRNYIGGEWTDGEGVSRNINPSNTDDVVGLYAQASAAQLDAAIAAARAAFPAWSRATPLVRHDALLRVSAAIAARRDELGDLLAREEGKTLPEAHAARRRAPAQIFKFFAGEALRVPGDRFASVRPGVEVEVTREPRRRRRHHHAVELPDRDPGVEDRAGARLRQHRRVQAGRSRTALGARARRHHRRAPACPPASSTSSWAAARRSARRCSTTR